MPALPLPFPQFRHEPAVVTRFLRRKDFNGNSHFPGLDRQTFVEFQCLPVRQQAGHDVRLLHVSSPSSATSGEGSFVTVGGLRENRRLSSSNPEPSPAKVTPSITALCATGSRLPCGSTR